MEFVRNFVGEIFQMGYLERGEFDGAFSMLCGLFVALEEGMDLLIKGPESRSTQGRSHDSDGNNEEGTGTGFEGFVDTEDHNRDTSRQESPEK